MRPADFASMAAVKRFIHSYSLSLTAGSASFITNWGWLICATDGWRTAVSASAKAMPNRRLAECMAFPCYLPAWALFGCVDVAGVVQCVGSDCRVATLLAMTG